MSLTRKRLQERLWPILQAAWLINKDKTAQCNIQSNKIGRRKNNWSRAIQKKYR